MELSIKVLVWFTKPINIQNNLEGLKTVLLDFITPGNTGIENSNHVKKEGGCKRGRKHRIQKKEIHFCNSFIIELFDNLSTF